MNICEEILRELYRLVREEGYASDLRRMQEIRFSYAGFNELRATRNLTPFVTFNVDCEIEKFYGIPVRIDGRQEAKFRVVCKPTGRLGNNRTRAYDGHH